MNDASNQSGPALEEPRVSLFGRRAKARAPSEPAQPQAAPPPPPRPIRKRRRQGLRALSGLLTFILIVSLIGMTGFVYVSTEANKPGPLAEDKVLAIVREDDGGSIPDQLERAGIIDNPLWFDATLGYVVGFTFRAGYARGLASGGMDKTYFAATVPF